MLRYIFSPIIETDSLLTIEVINGNNTLPYLIGNLDDDIRNLATSIDDITFQFCRSANSMADRITKFLVIVLFVISIIFILLLFKKKKKSLSCYSLKRKKHTI